MEPPCPPNLPERDISQGLPLWPADVLARLCLPCLLTGLSVADLVVAVNGVWILVETFMLKGEPRLGPGPS